MKSLQDIDMGLTEKLFFEYGEELYLLCFIHTSLPANASAILVELLGELAARPKRLAEAKAKGRSALLRQCHELCMQYYVKKPRKKIKTERLEKLNFPFPLTEKLVSVLHLPYSYKSPLVLSLGLSIPPAEVSKILGMSEGKIEKLLSRAESRTGMKRAGISALLAELRLPRCKLQKIFDRFKTAAAESGYSGKIKLAGFKRSMDNAVPYIAAAIVIFLIFAYLAVEFGWL